MRIAILSDFHFGFRSGTERADDPYEAFAEAIEKAKDCDLIIFGGDVFDTRNPDAETLTKAMELMIKPLLMQNDVKLVQGIGKDISKVSEIALMGTPIIAIHGTHERRTKGLLNPVEALEKAGFLVYLRCNGVIFEKGGERMAIQGMSGVPDQYAEGVLSNWNPKPEKGCFNILLLHQSVTEFLYAPHTLDLNKIPKGFDLYINGHIHEAKKSEYNGKPFLLTGSLIPTQLREESEKPKGFWVAETKGENVTAINWVELENQRKVYYRTFENEGIETIERELNTIIKENPEKKPIARLDLKGKVKDTLVNDIEMKFGDKLILSFKREREEKKIPTKTPEEHKLSVEEMGRKILLENLRKSGLDPKIFENLFELLAEGRSEEAMDRLMEIPAKTEKPKKKGKEGGEKGKVKQTILFRPEN
ncbi:MAG: DNA repair exonuclease [Candidatus Aenigmarchaeota archaeon]